MYIRDLRQICNASMGAEERVSFLDVSQHCNGQFDDRTLLPLAGETLS